MYFISHQFNRRSDFPLHDPVMSGSFLET